MKLKRRNPVAWELRGLGAQRIPGKRDPGPAVGEWGLKMFSWDYHDNGPARPCSYPDCEDPGDPDWVEEGCPDCNPEEET